MHISRRKETEEETERENEFFFAMGHRPPPYWLISICVSSFGVWQDRGGKVVNEQRSRDLIVLTQCGEKDTKDAIELVELYLVVMSYGIPREALGLSSTSDMGRSRHFQMTSV